MSIKIRVRKRALRTPKNTGEKIVKRNPSVEIAWAKRQRCETDDMMTMIECTAGILLTICVFLYIFVLDKNAPFKHLLPWYQEFSAVRNESD